MRSESIPFNFKNECCSNPNYEPKKQPTGQQLFQPKRISQLLFQSKHSGIQQLLNQLISILVQPKFLVDLLCQLEWCGGDNSGEGGAFIELVSREQDLVTRTSYKKQEQGGLFKREVQLSTCRWAVYLLGRFGQEEESQIDWVNGHCVNRWKAVSDS